MNNDRTLCFIINDKNICLDCVLIEFNTIPMLFICKDNKDYYLCLCYDLEEQNYYVVKCEAVSLRKMVQGKIPMVDLFVHSEQLWDVHSAEDIEKDEVVRISAQELDESVLPYHGACYEIVDEDVSEYVRAWITKEDYSDGMMKISGGKSLFEDTDIIISASISNVRKQSKPFERSVSTYGSPGNNFGAGVMIRNYTSVSFIVQESKISDAA